MPADPARIPFLLRESQPVTIADDTIKAQYTTSIGEETPRESFFVNLSDAAAVLAERKPWFMSPNERWAIETNDVRLYGLKVPLAKQLPTFTVVDNHQGKIVSRCVMTSFAVDLNDDKTAKEVRGY